MKPTQTPIPCAQMRGGTSKGLYFCSRDLPDKPALRDRVLLTVMGGPDSLQIDGVGGGHPLSSKVAVISPSTRTDADVDYLFLQVSPSEQRVDSVQNCGNILAGVGPFAIEVGMVNPNQEKTRVKVHMVNSDNLCELTVMTPNARVQYEGITRIDGVPGSAAPIVCDFLDVAGSACGALLPSGNVKDEIEGIAVTLIDNGMPVVVVRAADLDCTGYESPQALDDNEELKKQLESIRLEAGRLMNLGNVKEKTVPKMTLIAAPRHDGHISTRTFIPKICHKAIGVLGAVSVATAAVTPGSVADGVADVPRDQEKTLSVEHPSGTFQVRLAVETDTDGPVVKRAGVIRTARMLFRGEVLVPHTVWHGGRTHNQISKVQRRHTL